MWEFCQLGILASCSNFGPPDYVFWAIMSPFINSLGQVGVRGKIRLICFELKQIRAFDSWCYHSERPQTGTFHPQTTLNKAPWRMTLLNVYLLKNATSDRP